MPIDPSSASSPPPLLLKASGIEKHYGGVHALRGVDFEVAMGEVHALCGENGAGKSTLGKIIAGAVRPDAGTIAVDGKPVVFCTPLDARRHGIGIIFQELDLFPHLTVAENIVLGNPKVERGALVSFKQIASFCARFLEQVGLRCGPDKVLNELPIAHVQLVAIARALSMDARLIVMDEPTSALSDDAVETLFGLIGDLRRRGVSIVYVSHKMKEIFQIADRITVLRDGNLIGTAPAAQTSVDRIITMMVGRELKHHERSCNHCRDDVVLSATGLRTKKLENITFDLRAGEVLGVAGLVGAGRSELGAALFGLDPLTGGTIRLQGKSIKPKSPRHAIRCGIGLLPEDRKLQGLMMQSSVRHNSTLAVLDRYNRFGFVRGGTEMDAMKRVHDRTRLKTAGYDVPVAHLSGGNQQKVLLAKWLLVDPPVIFLDDPTRGIDIAAKQDIYDLIEELSAKGKGLILVSSELPELLRCCDRIMVLHAGRSAGIVPIEQATQERIMAMATGSVATT